MLFKPPLPLSDEVNTTESLTQAGLFEGDILLTEAQERFVQNDTGNVSIFEALKAEVWQVIACIKFVSFLTPDMASKNDARYGIE